MDDGCERYQRARAAYPDLVVSAEVFAAWLAEREVPGTPLYVEDLYLACACASGDPLALGILKKMLAPDLAAVRGRHGYLPADEDDFLQLVYEKLFVGPHPKIHEFAGRGELRAWVRVALTRMVLNAATRDTRECPVGEEIFLALPAATDPEAETIRRHHGEALRLAFIDAASRLSTRDRNMLRYVIVNGLGIDAIAKIYAVHRATAARHVADARDALGVELRAALKQRLGITESALASVLRSLQSQVELNMSAYLERSR